MKCKRSVLVAWLVTMGLAGCNRPHPDKAASALVGQTSEGSNVSVGDQFCLMALEVELATPASRRMASVSIDSRWAKQSLRQLSELAIPPKGTATRCTDFAPSRRVGVALAVDYAARDQNPELVRPDAAGPDAELLVSLIAHVERAGSGGGADVAKHTLEVAAPMPDDRSDVLVARIVSRLSRAATQATQSALGQLWARDQSLATLRQTADSKLTWKQSAAILELGERNDQKSVALIERAAADSRAAVAQVSCAALGRLASSTSVPVLTRQLRFARSTETADAAMYALHDIGTASAWEQLTWAAGNHPSQWIRLRAQALLDAKDTGKAAAPSR